MDRAELKNWAKEKIKGHIWEILVPVLVASILTSLTIGGSTTIDENGAVSVHTGLQLGLFFYFVEVGLALFMVKFVNGHKGEFKDLFYFAKDYVRVFVVGLLKGIFVFLWALLLVIPGIIKAFAYALVELLLADEKYNDLGYTAVLKKSEDMMNGHKMDLFVFELSYLGWHLLAPFTLFLLEIWIIPYYTTAKFKFLDNIKKSYEEKNPNNTVPTPETNDSPEVLETITTEPTEPLETTTTEQ